MTFSAQTVQLKNSQSIVLRSATPQDAENMLEHLKTAHAESYKNFNRSAAYWQNMPVADEQKILTDFENSKSKFMMVAVSGCRIIGALGFVGYDAEFNKHSGHLGMGIQQAFANSGLGTEMMKYAFKIAREFGFHRMDLSVRTYNAPAIALYEKVGFKRVGLLLDAAFIDGKYVDEYSYQIIL